MKKILLTLAAGAFALTSCDKQAEATKAAKDAGAAVKDAAAAAGDKAAGAVDAAKDAAAGAADAAKGAAAAAGDKIKDAAAALSGESLSGLTGIVDALKNAASAEGFAGLVEKIKAFNTDALPAELKSAVDALKTAAAGAANLDALKPTLDKVKEVAGKFGVNF